MEYINIWDFLIQVAPVVLVMGIAVKALWTKNAQLTEDLKQSDKENLKTLNHLSNAITKLSDDGNRQFNDLKEHITERVGTISEQIRSR